jgi:hypothetical protein
MSVGDSNRGRWLCLTFAVAFGAVLTACGSTAPPASSSGATAPTNAAATSAAGTSGGNTALPTCPTGTAVSAAAGSPYPTPSVQTTSTLVTCNYADTTTGANLVLVISATDGVSASVLQQVVQSQATAQHATVNTVSGLGDAAYTFTLSDAATNVTHVATTILEVLKGSYYLDITAEASLAQTESVARLILSQ